jgi:hypothetical protein
MLKGERYAGMRKTATDGNKYFSPWRRGVIIALVYIDSS